MSRAAELYVRWIAAWNGDLDLIDSLVTPSFVIHQVRQDGRPSEAMRGPGALRSLIAEARDPFLDINFEVELGPIDDGHCVAARWTGTAHTSGGERVRFAGHDILRVEGERFSEYWVLSAVLPDHG